MTRLSLCFIFIAVLQIHRGNAEFKCFSCTGGPRSNCAKALSQYDTENCNTTCFETYVVYQSGAFPLIDRRCWVVPNNTNKSYCDWLPSQSSILNTNATIKSCRTCTSSKCNGSKNLAPVISTCSA